MLNSNRSINLNTSSQIRTIAVIVAVLLGFASGGVLAQHALSTIRGNVTDVTGAIIPGLEITVREENVGVAARSVISDDNGNYEMPDLKPGTYVLTATLPGFKTFVAEGVVVLAGQIRRIDITLEVGEVTESVTVTAGTAAITTDTGSISESFGVEKLQDTSMPTMYPSPFAAMSTLPGIQGRSWQVEISGQERAQRTSAFDGIPNDRTGGQENNLNFFKEIAVSAVNATPEQSRVGGYNMISKTGANDFHAMAYYKHYNSGMEARRFFEPTRTPFIQHEFQFEAGGPIVKDKTYYYASWLRQRFPLGSFRRSTMPTELMRQGNFSEIGKDIIDPLTGDPFPGNVIPAGRMNPTSLKVQQLFTPIPNLGGLSNNYGFHHDYPSDLYVGDWPFFRIDHNVSEDNTLFGRFLQRRTPYVLARNAGEIFAWTRLRNHYQTAVGDTHVFSPGVVNTFKFGWASDYIIDGDEQDGFTPLNGADTIKQIGLQGVNPQNLNAQGFPRMDITGFTSLETRPGGLNDDNDNFTFDNATTWSVGRHVFKFGAQFYTFEDWIGIIPSNNWGRYRFNGSMTGDPYADFLLGLPWRTQRVNPFVDRNRTQKEMALYFRDTFKVSPKLSVDYGLRWDYYSSPTFDDGLQFNWDPQTGNVIVPEAALASISPLYPDNINVVTGQVVADPELSNFRPRIGFAYRLREDLVVRGGYGTFTERIGYFSRSFGGGPFEIAEDYRQSLSDFVNGQPLFQFPNPFLDVSSSRVPSQSISSYPLQTDEGTIHQFNLSVEKRVSDTGFRISYIGSRNRGQNYSLNTNKPRPSATPFSTDLRPFPQFVSTNVIRADGSSNYDSLQLQAEKKVGAVTFNAHWTWANNMVNFLNRENPLDVTSHWARDASTRRQRVVVNTGFELPFGRGHRYLSDASGVVEQLLGGWKVQTVSILATGEYLSPSFSGSDPSNTNSFGGLPDRIADGNLSSPTVDRWFDGSAFVRPPAGVGRFGNSGVNILEGQGMNVHHASLAKTFPIGERFNLVYTAAFSNLFNHPHFNSIRRNVTASDPGKYVSIHNAFWAEKGSHRRVIMKLRLEF